MVVARQARNVGTSYPTLAAKTHPDILLLFVLAPSAVHQQPSLNSAILYSTITGISLISVGKYAKTGWTREWGFEWLHVRHLFVSECGVCDLVRRQRALSRYSRFTRMYRSKLRDDSTKASESMSLISQLWMQMTCSKDDVWL